MKSILPLLLLLLAAAVSPAQIVTKDFDSPVMQSFISGKTYAVLSNDADFDEWFQGIVERHWTVSQVSFIKPAELDSLVRSDKNFILFAQAKDDKSSSMRLLNTDDLAKKKEYYVVLSQGGHKQTKLLFTTALTGAKIIGSFRYSPERASIGAGRIEGEMLLALMNQSLQIIIERQIKSEVKDSVKYVITDELAAQIADKTLLFSLAYTDGSISLEDKPLLTQKVMQDYPYAYEEVEHDAVESRLENDPAAYAYLFLYFPSQYIKVSDDSGDILVYDPAQKKFLYFDDNLNGPWFEKWKMKDLVYAIKSR
jgi:hypothetical protein